MIIVKPRGSGDFKHGELGFEVFERAPVVPDPTQIRRIRNTRQKRTYEFTGHPIPLLFAVDEVLGVGLLVLLDEADLLIELGLIFDHQRCWAIDHSPGCSNEHMLLEAFVELSTDTEAEKEISGLVSENIAVDDDANR